jgi:predicted hydrocarbon binding protein
LSTLVKEQQQVKRPEQEFWKDFLTMADYFNHAIVPLQKHFELKSEDIFHSLGASLGKDVAERYPEADLKEALNDMSKLWGELRIGRLSVEKTDPLELMISDCMVCGQLAGSGEMYDCPFHEGFFQSFVSSKLGKDVHLKQVTNFEGSAGTWCRKFVVSDKS